jgi:hypothetical protein
MSDSLPPPGWYPNPSGEGRRYWDGAEWTSAVASDSDTVAAPPSAIPNVAAPGGPGPVEVPADPQGPRTVSSSATPWAGRSAGGASSFPPAGAGPAMAQVQQRVRSLPPIAWIGVVAVVVLAFVLVGRGGSQDIEGSFSLFDSRFLSYSSGESCSGSGGYGDIGAGRSVTVKDSSGTVIATGSLGPGSIRLGACVFDFELRDVPRSEYYTFEVGRRGELTYSHDELRSAGWWVGFSLGD